MKKLFILTLLLLIGGLFFINEIKEANAIDEIIVNLTHAITPMNGATFNLSVNVNSTAHNVTNVTFVLIAPNGTSFTIGTAIGNQNRLNLTSFSLLFDSTGFADNYNYTINATARNQTNANAAKGQNSSTGRTFNGRVLQAIDNTRPTSTYGSSTPAAASTVYTGTATLDTASDASLELNNCTLYFTAPGQTATTTLVRNGVSDYSCSSTQTFTESGTYSFYWTATDGTNTTTFPTRIFSYDTGGAGGGVSGSAADGGSGGPITTPAFTIPNLNDNTKNLLIIAGIIFAVWLLSRKK